MILSDVNYFRILLPLCDIDSSLVKINAFFRHETIRFANTGKRLYLKDYSLVSKTKITIEGIYSIRINKFKITKIANDSVRL